MTSQRVVLPTPFSAKMRVYLPKATSPLALNASKRPIPCRLTIFLIMLKPILGLRFAPSHAGLGRPAERFGCGGPRHRGGRLLSGHVVHSHLGLPAVGLNHP